MNPFQVDRLKTFSLKEYRKKNSEYLSSYKQT